MNHITINHYAAELNAQHKMRDEHQKAENRRIARQTQQARPRFNLNLGKHIANLVKQISLDIEIQVMNEAESLADMSN